jgi:hypothetical protein
VDRVHGAVGQRCGRVDGGPAGIVYNGRAGASVVRGARVLEVTGAHRRWLRRTSKTRCCQRGAQQSTSGGGEAAR